MDDYPGILLTREQLWIKHLNDVDIYITNEKKRPPCKTSLGGWLNNQLTDSKRTPQTPNMTNIWKIFHEKHKPYLLTKKEFWLQNYEKALSHMKLHGKLPLNTENKNLKDWIIKQTKIYNKPNKWSYEHKEKWQYFLEKYGFLLLKYNNVPKIIDI